MPKEKVPQCFPTGACQRLNNFIFPFHPPALLILLRTHPSLYFSWNSRNRPPGPSCLTAPLCPRQIKFLSSKAPCYHGCMDTLMSVPLQMSRNCQVKGKEKKIGDQIGNHWPKFQGITASLSIKSCPLTDLKLWVWIESKSPAVMQLSHRCCKFPLSTYKVLRGSISSPLEAAS